MKRGNMTAAKLRIILSSALFVITAIGIGLFYFANNMLSQVATDVSRTVADAGASQNNLQALQQTEDELIENQEVVKRADDIVANSQSYQYQNQIINDLNNYAARSGITLTNIDFSDPAGDTASTPGATVSPAGVKTAVITVTLKNPVNYDNLLRLMQSIEQNLTKMQLSSISLTQGQEGVSSDILSITVYVR